MHFIHWLGNRDGLCLEAEKCAGIIYTSFLFKDGKSHRDLYEVEFTQASVCPRSFVDKTSQPPSENTFETSLWSINTKLHIALQTDDIDGTHKVEPHFYILCH
jgi:hypothetical protein